ncbi:hypothetical protein H6G00_06460 [Leptolyngbya sp. FACHB-541]|uniref:hypothetical protein n=1 Tax=Leptolyngbya sp. FACHB-541 TaxID=2692810 RepID=UPI0016892702|nr:hypothetical protein [Leptolyngbya sp. FACHB-541]MBD1996260.1 hypothetical protein [Leptolyngbya sp. FACHB-541]
MRQQSIGSIQSIPSVLSLFVLVVFLIVLLLLEAKQYWKRATRSFPFPWGDRLIDSGK